MTGGRFALLIAAGRYDQPGLRLLRSPQYDVDGLGEVLRDPRIGGFEVHRLIDGRHHEVNRAIEVFFRDRGLNQMLLLHISCHGIKNDSGELFFAARDTDRELLASTAVSAAFLQAQMRGCRARSIVLLLDCCYSGAFLTGSKGDDSVLVAEELAGRGRAVLTATSRTEYAWEGDRLDELGPEPSHFTGALIEGLRSGEADHDRDGLVTVTDLYHYVYERMRAARLKQRPQMWAELEHRVVIAYSARGDLAGNGPLDLTAGPLDPRSGPIAAVPQAEASTVRPLRLADRYELGHLLGRGGATEVHRARDTRLGRTAAVKTLGAGLADDASVLARFRRAARSAARLNHPAIVAVYDAGEDCVDGVRVPYIVMEYVDGVTLRELLRPGRRMPPERCLEITVEVLRALEYAHRKGVVHRDVQPANVMLTRTGQVKVTDFGIGRAMGGVGVSTRRSAAMTGTVHYLSPEQAKGERVDARSDLYSTGCLLYELLAGRPPFIGDVPVAIAYQHMRADPSPPSVFDAGIPPAVDAVALRALVKEPNDRYQSAVEMRTDIETHLYGRVGASAGAPDPTAEQESGATKSSCGEGDFVAGPGLADPITLSTQLCESCAVVRFGGELDYASSWFVAELLRDLRTQGRVHYVVVFEEAALLDSAGLNTFLAHLDAVRALGGSMRVVIESSVIRRVFEVTGVDGVLLVDHSLDEAMTAMRATANCPDQ